MDIHELQATHAKRVEDWRKQCLRGGPLPAFSMR
jgi:hypothetical protein